MCDGIRIEGVLYGWSARVGHDDQRHAPLHALPGYPSEVGQHLRFRLGADVHMHRNRVSAQFNGFLDGGDQYLAVGIHTEVGGCRQMQNQPHIVPAAPVPLRNDSLVHQDCRGTSLRHIADRSFHIRQAGDRPYAHSVIHWDNDGVSAVPVHDSLHSDVFTEHWYHRVKC